MNNDQKITVFTPTYNRAKSIHRVYESLLEQTYKNFIWLIIDDGSTDNTKEIIEKFITENKIQIKYIYQENQGKHIAVNNAVKVTDTELFLIADSDDAFLPNSLEVFVNTWDSIDIKEREQFKGIIARCFDSNTKKVIGNDFPMKQFDANELDAKFKYKISGEKWGIFKTDVLKEFPFPEIHGLKFFPETVVWQKIARKYKTRYIDMPLREYFRDQENSLTSKHNERYKENIYLWEHLINNIFDYFWYNPKLFFKAFVGLTRDGLRNGYTFKKILSIPNRYYKKIGVFIFSPVGALLYKKEL